MEYNTQRPQLKISDYGRVVSKLIDKAKAIESREARSEMARLIVDVMAHVNPKIKERTDYKRILWDHLMIMSDYSLDVDCPYSIERHDGEDDHPASMQYSQGSIKFRHYGKAMESMIAAAADMEEGEERDALVSQIAHAMKRLYVHWNSDNDDDDLIRQQLHDLSGGRITLPVGFQFHDSKYYADSVAASNGKKEGGKKKKKKKNK